MIRTVLLALLVVCGMPLASARMRTLLTKGNHATIHNEMNFPVGMSLGDDFDPKTQPPPVVVLPGQSHDWTTSSHSIGFNLYRMCPGKIDDESNTWQRLCELKQDNPNIGKQIVQDVPWPSAVVKTMDGDNPYLYTGAPYIYLQCRTKNGMFEQQSVLEGGGQDVQDDEGHTKVHFHRNKDTSYKEFEIYLRNLIGYDSLKGKQDVPWGDACDVGQA